MNAGAKRRLSCCQGRSSERPRLLPRRNWRLESWAIGDRSCGAEDAIIRLLGPNSLGPVRTSVSVVAPETRTEIRLLRPHPRRFDAVAPLIGFLLGSLAGAIFIAPGELKSD